MDAPKKLRDERGFTLPDGIVITALQAPPTRDAKPGRAAAEIGFIPL